MAKFDPFLSLDCAGFGGRVAAIGKWCFAQVQIVPFDAAEALGIVDTFGVQSLDCFKLCWVYCQGVLGLD